VGQGSAKEVQRGLTLISKAGNGPGGGKRAQSQTDVGASLDYEALRELYRPSPIRALFVAESPPRSDSYRVLSLPAILSSWKSRAARRRNSERLQDCQSWFSGESVDK